MEVIIVVEDGDRRRRTHQTLRLNEVEKVSLAMVFWTVKQIEQQYRLSGSGMIITWEDMLDNNRDWWIMALQMEPFPGGETMPQAMMEYLIHERGIPCRVDRKERLFPAPHGHVPWAEKLRIYKTCPGFNPPGSWVNGEPPFLVWALLKRCPVAVPCVGDPDFLNPRGCGYYAVVKMDLSPHSSLYKDLQIRSVIPC